MKKYCLDKREVRYLTNQYNNDLMGIGYSLGVDGQDELRIQESLLSKGYAISDFECPFSIEEDLAAILNECNQWNKIVHISSTSLDRSDAFERFFIMQDTVVHETKEENTVCIEKTDKTAINDRLTLLFTIQKTPATTADESFLINAKRIEILSRLRKERLLREMQIDGCPEQLSEYMADAFTGRGEYASVTVIERTPTDIRYQAKLTVCCLKDAFLIIHPETRKEKQCIRFDLGSLSKLGEELAGIRSAIE